MATSLLAHVVGAYGDGPRGEEPLRAVVVSSTQMIIRVNPETVMKISIQEAGSGAIASASFTPVEPKSQWILLAIDGGSLKFKPAKQYVVTLVLNDGDNTSQMAKAESVFVDTSPQVTLVHSFSGPMFLESDVALSLKGSSSILFNNPNFCTGGQVVTVLTRHNSNKRIYFNGFSSPLGFSKICEFSLRDLDKMSDANSVGVMFVKTGTIIPHISNLTGVFKGTIVDVLGEDLRLQQAPGGQKSAPDAKSNAWLWMNGTVTAGSGTSPAWVLDGKLEPPQWQFWWLGAQVTPVTVNANIGNNKINGVAAKDVIDFEIPSLTWLPPVIQGKLTTQIPASLTLETNRAFNHRNLLAVGDVLWDWSVLNQSQAVRTAEAWWHGGQGDQTFKMPPQGKFGKGGYLSEGWMLHFHTGLETGKALTTTLVTNPKTKATIGVVPTYPIVRFVPQVDGTYQFRNFSLESFVTGRYLFTTEHTAVNDKAGIPYLETVSGWKAVNVLTFTWVPFASQNIGFNVAYTDGFSAPTYQRANGVKIGLLIKY
jgi:hypothetical protein